MFRYFITVAAFITAPAIANDSAVPPAIPEGAALIEAIHAADTELFELAIGGCDPVKLRGMVTDDMEFYHDKGGVTAKSGDEFVAEYAKNCDARMAPDAWHVRRALVLETLHVDPVPGFGAIETGEHLFYERQGEGPEKLVGKAAFAQVWRYDDGVWKTHRVLSFAHKPAN